MSSPTPGWYPDPENPTQARWFDGANWTDSTQPIASVSGATTGSVNSPPGSGNRGRTALVAGGAIAAVAITLIAGLLVWRTMNGVEEVSAREYSKQFCDQFEEQAKALETAGESMSDAYERLDLDYDSDTSETDYSGVGDREATDYRDAFVAQVDAYAAWIDATETFASGHQLRGSGGEDLRTDLLEWSDDAKGWIAEARSDLGEVDLNDPADAVESMEKIDLGYDGLNESDEATEVRDEFPEEEDNYCLFPYSDD